MIQQVVYAFIDDLMLPIAAFLFALPFPKRKQNSLIRFIALFSVFVLLQLGILLLIWLKIGVEHPFFLNAQIIHSLLLILWTALLIYFVFHIEPANTIVCVTLGFTMQNLVANICNLLHWADRISVYFIKHALVGCIVLIFAWFCFARRIRHADVNPRLSYCLIVLFVTIMAFIVVPSQLYRFDLGMNGEEISTILRISSIILNITICEMIVEMILGIQEHNASSQLNLMLEQKREQYENAREMMELVRVKYHDLRHYLNNGAPDGEIATQLSREMIEGIQKVDVQYDTGRKSLDVVLTEKGLRCIREGITFSCIADGEALYFMESVDIYTLLSNILDNAIESAAAGEKEQRIISMNLHKKNRLTMLTVENFCPNEIEWKNGDPVTTKTNEDWHGYGIKSIRMIMKKYDGTLQMNQEGEMFILRAVFPLKENPLPDRL